MPSTPLCTVKGCPEPKNPDFHIPICGHGLEGHHHHVVKRSQGGKGGAQVFICPSCHSVIDNEGGALFIENIKGQGKTIWAVNLRGEQLFSRIIGTDGVAAEANKECFIGDGKSTAAALPEGEEDELGEHISGHDSRGGDTPDNQRSVAPPSSDGAEARDITGFPESRHGPVSGEPAPESSQGTSASSPDWGTWDKKMRSISMVGRLWRWEFGDAANEGELFFNERAWNTLSEIKLDYVTVRNMMRICAKVPESLRSGELNWTHYQSLYSLNLEDMEEWVGWAIENNAKTKELTVALREAGLKPMPEPKMGKCPECGHEGERREFIA